MKKKAYPIHKKDRVKGSKPAKYKARCDAKNPAMVAHWARVTCQYCINRRSETQYIPVKDR